ncbi:MAG: hypothetical protein AB1773_09850 [Pseudomonadota bacterium]|jgi:hypothetical protein
MTLLRRLFRFLDRRRGARAMTGYGPEVLFAGWVDIPAALQRVMSRRP